MPVGQPAPAEIEDEAEGDPRQQQAGEHLGGRDHDVPRGVQTGVPLRPEVATVCAGARRRLEVDALGTSGGCAVGGGYDEPDGAAARSRRDHDDGRLLQVRAEVLDRDADDGPALPLRDLDAVDLQRHGRAPAGPRHPGNETVPAEVEGVGLRGHGVIIECALY